MSYTKILAVIPNDSASAPVYFQGTFDDAGNMTAHKAIDQVQRDGKVEYSRNLLQNSTFTPAADNKIAVVGKAKVLDWNTNNWYFTNTNGDDGSNCLAVSRTGLTADEWQAATSNFIPYTPDNGPISVSARGIYYDDVKMVSGDRVCIVVEGWTATGTARVAYHDCDIDLSIANAWQTVGVNNYKFTDPNIAYIRIAFNSSRNGHCKFTKPKVVIGSEGTGVFTVSPEDVLGTTATA